ncbi:MAG: ATP-binding cassette domain-containing protein [Bacteroidales bacterium]|nr:ATP-binding cassette domain-containing protein [Bacteroidales bacterium]
MSALLEIKGLTKHYGDYAALDHVNLDVESGAVFGLLGPNGAGKTTLLRIINSILVKDEGSVSIDGREACLDVTSKLIGYMPEERGLYGKMRVDEQIMYFGRLRGASKEVLMKNMHEYMGIFNISDNDRHRKVEELSKGNQQKVQIISTLVHDPKLVILDEPFSGFDPINGQLLQDLITRLREKGATVILSSHNMPAIEEMCSHIGLINKGKLLLSGKLADIKETHRTGLLSLTTASALHEGMLMDSGLVKSVKKADTVVRPGTFSYEIMPLPGVSNNDILSNISIQANILGFGEILPTLSDLFLQYTTQATPQ